MWCREHKLQCQDYNLYNINVQNDFPCQDKEAPLAYRKNNVMLLCKCNKIYNKTNPKASHYYPSTLNHNPLLLCTHILTIINVMGCVSSYKICNSFTLERRMTRIIFYGDTPFLALSHFCHTDGLKSVSALAFSTL